MIEAVVAALLRAIVVSLVAGCAFAGLVALAVRAVPLRAATRHTLWSIALLATTIVPVASLAGSFAHRTSVENLAHHAAAATSAVPTDRHVPAWKPGRITAAVPPGTPATTKAVPPAAEPRSWVPALRLPQFPPLTQTAAIAIVVVWAAGALIGFIALAASLARVRSLKARSSPLDAALCDELPWLVALDESRETYLRLSYEIETPIAIGFSRPVILIPTELATAEGLGAIESLVVHEHAHLQRYDDWTNMLGRIVERLFWFHPVVWWIGRQIALEREIAADDAVVERTGEATAYATSLWQLAREMRMPAHAAVAPGALFTRKQIAVRIEQLVDENRTRLRRSPALAGFAAVVGALVVFALGVSAPAMQLPAPLADPTVALGTQHVVAWTALRGQERSSVSHPPKSATSHTATSAQRTVAPSSHPAAAHRAMPASNPSVPPVSSTATAPKHPSSVPALAAGAARTTAVSVMSGPQGAAARSVAAGPKAAVATVVTTTAAATKTATSTASSSSPATASAAVHTPLQRVSISRLPSGVKVADAPVPPLTRLTHLPGMSESDLREIESIDTKIRTEIGGNLGRQIGADVAESVRRSLQNADRNPMEGRHRQPDPNVPVTRDLVANCVGCDFSKRDLRGLDLHGLSLTGMCFEKADLRGANLAGARISGSNFSRANLEGVDLRGATLRGVDLDRADIEGAKLDNVTAVGLNLSRIAFGTTPVRALLNHCIGCNLANFDLSGQDLHGISLRGANLSGANLRGVNLSGAQLTGVDFSEANLADADLREAKLTGCNFTRANLIGVKLSANDAIRSDATSDDS